MAIEHFLEFVVPYITSSLELIGVAIIAIAAARALFQFFKNGFDFRGDDVAIDFAKAMTLSLEFKLAAEIIKTVVIRTIDEFIILASVAILRVVLSFVLHWELKTGAKNVDHHSPNPEDLAIDPAEITKAKH
ncbi:MAG: DUF1622 domain-containing protein [Gudongella sp.]|nr:DUF1622 domain-containing protein [Gudongella sp.]